jgi:protein CpxP
MTMTPKKIVVAGALAFVAIPAVLVLAAFRQGSERRGAMTQKFLEWRINEKLGEIKATDAQKQQVMAIEQDLAREGHALRKGNRDFHKAILAELRKDSPDAAQVHALVNARAETMKAFADKVADGVLQVHGILTADQRAQVLKEFDRMARHIEHE